MAAGRHRDRGHGARRVDWALILLVILCLGLFMATVIRSTTSAETPPFGRHIGGLRALSDTETLVAFEPDGPLGASWSGGQANTDPAGLGSVWLADPSNQPLTRVIPLPEGTARAILSFDLIAMDDWSAHGLSVSIDGAEVLRQGFAAGDQGLPPAQATSPPSDIALRSRITGPRRLAGPPVLSVQHLHLDIAVRPTQGSITLTLAPLATEAQADDPVPLWALDNFVVVAEGPL